MRERLLGRFAAKSSVSAENHMYISEDVLKDAIFNIKGMKDAFDKCKYLCLGITLYNFADRTGAYFVNASGPDLIEFTKSLKDLAEIIEKGPNSEKNFKIPASLLKSLEDEKTVIRKKIEVINSKDEQSKCYLENEHLQELKALKAAIEKLAAAHNPQPVVIVITTPQMAFHQK